jgi:hypothetical protein
VGVQERGVHRAHLHGHRQPERENATDHTAIVYQISRASSL